MEEFELDNCIDIQFKYEFESCLGDTEGSHYIQDIKASIVRCDEQVDEPLLIGQSKIKILLLEQAMNDDYSIYDVFDTYDYTMRIGRMIYNFDHDCITPDLYMKLFGKKDMLNSNICIFERLEILPEYRGLGIGAKFIKDKYINFSSTFIIKWSYKWENKIHYKYSHYKPHMVPRFTLQSKIYSIYKNIYIKSIILHK